MSRSRAALFGAFVVLVLVASIVVFAIQAEGREGSEAFSNDGGAWLVNQRAGSIGHVNRVVRELSSAVRVSQPLADFDVYQPDGIVVVHDRSSGVFDVVDERVHQSTNSMEVVDDLVVSRHDRGLVVQAVDPFRIWSLPAGVLAEVESLRGVTPLYEGDPVVFGVSSRGVVVVAHSDRSLSWFDEAGVSSIAAADVDGPVRHVMFDGDQAFVAIGDRVGVVDDGRVRVLDGEVDRWLVAGVASAERTGSLVVVTTDRRVVRIDTSTGLVGVVGEVSGSRVVRPIEHQGCVYGLSTEPAQFWVQCGSGLPQTTDLSSASVLDLRLRLVNGWIWVNDLATGRLWFVDEQFELSEIDDWGSVLPRTESADSRELPPTDGDDNVVTDVENPDAEDSEIIDADEFDEDGVNQPPVANDDLDTRVAQGRPAVVNVVANDTDPDNDVLLISEVVNESGGDAVVVASADGTHIQVTAAPNFVGVISYSYTISDGRGGSDTASGSVLVVQRTGESNQPPVAVTDVAAITAGDRLVLDVVANDTDPDGDSLVLIEATAPEGTISFDPSGQIIFEPASTSEEGEIELSYVITDDFGERAEGVARVRVRLEGSNQPPDARNDGAITVVGQPVTINVLANDTDPDGDDLFVAQRPTLLSPAGVDVFTTISPDGEFVMIPDQAGTYIFSYAASDDEDSDIAQIRIEVTEPTQNRAPVALRDDIVIPTGGSRIVYALANDSDPDGDVIGIVDLSVPPGSGMRVERYLDVGFRVFVDSDGASRRTFSYAISDGKASPVRTTVVVAVAETTALNNPPIAEPDTIEVRAGTTVSVPVLDNDFDPEGGSLRVVAVSTNSRGLTEIGPGGQSVKLTVHPDTTTSYTLNYDIIDDHQNQTASIIRVRVVAPDQPNRPPIARPDDARTPAGQPVNIDVIANDSDPDGDPIRVESITVQPASGTVEIDPTGEIIYTPAPGFSGTDRFSYTITDALGARNTGEVLIGVLEPPTPNRDPVATNDSYLTVATGQQSTLNALNNDSDPDGDQLTIRSISQPSIGQATLNAERSAIFYIAPINQPDDQTITITYDITDNNGGSATATITILVQASPEIPDGVTLPPIAADDFVGPVPSRTPLRIDVVANDRDPDTPVDDLIVRLLDNQNQATVDGQTIVINAPESSTEFDYQLLDADANLATATVFITVVDPEPPIAIDDSAGPAKQGDIVAIDALINDFDPDGEINDLTIVSTSAAGAAISGSTITIEAPPTSTQFNYTIQDADGLQDTATISLLVVENRAPTIEATAHTTNFEEPIEIDLTSTATDPDGDPLLFSCCQSARNGSPDVIAVGENQLIVRFTPNNGFSGDAVFTFNVDDQFGHQVAGSTTITVGEQPNRAPTTTNHELTREKPRPDGQPITTDIDLAPLTNDPDNDELTWNLVTTNGLDATISESTLTLNITDQTNTGETELTWNATDPGGESTNGTITITIEPAQNTPPTANNDRVEVAAGTTTTINLDTLTNDPDPNEELSFAIDAPSTEGITTTLTGTATITIAATVNATGATNTLNYTVTDRLGTEATGTINITVTEPNQDPPTANPDTANTLQGVPVDIDVLSNDNDPIGSGLTIVNPGGTTDGSIELVGAAIRFTPSIDFYGTTEFIYTIRDIANTANRETTATVTIEVTGRPATPAPPICTPTSNEANITWTAPAGNGASVDNYTLEYEQIDSQTAGAPTQTSRTSATITELQNGQSHHFRVQATNIAGNSNWSNWSTPCTPDIEPEQPAPPQIVHGDQYLDLTWTEPPNEGSDITEYEIRIGGGSTQTSTDTTLRWTGLDNGTDYTFQIAARNQAGLSTFSTASTPEHPSTVPTAPVINNTTRAGLLGANASGILQVNWTPVPTTADGGDTVLEYHVEQRDNTTVTVTGANTSNYTWSGLPNGTAHQFRVTAINRDGPSTPSAWSTPITPCTIPDAPTAVTASPSDLSATVTFDSPFSDGGCEITSYDIRTEGTTNNANTVPNPGTHTINSLTNGTTIAFKIRATNAIGNGPWTTTNAITPAGLPICTDTARHGIIEQDTVNVYFSTANFNGGTDLGYEFNTNDAGWLPLSSRDLLGIRFSVLPTAPNIEHTIKIRAVNSIGSSSCGSLSFLSCSPDPPAPAQPSIAMNIANRTATVRWEQPTVPCLAQEQAMLFIESYEVDADLATPIQTRPVEARWAYVHHVALGTSTRARVRTCDIDSCGAWSPWSQNADMPTTVQVRLDFEPNPPASPFAGRSITDYHISTDEHGTNSIGHVDIAGYIEAPLAPTDPNKPPFAAVSQPLYATHRGACIAYRFYALQAPGQTLEGTDISTGDCVPTDGIN